LSNRIGILRGGGRIPTESSDDEDYAEEIDRDFMQDDLLMTEGLQNGKDDEDSDGSGMSDSEEINGNQTTTDQYPTPSQILRWFPLLDKPARHVLEDLAGSWIGKNLTDGAPQPDGEVGMSLESVWKDDQQVGLRVCEVFEGARPEATGGVAMGDWLVSIHGVQCSSLTVAAVGTLMMEVDPNTQEVEVVMRRRWPGDDDGPNGKGATYSFKLDRQWVGDGEEVTKEQAEAMETEAIDFLKNWQP
jgi:hypothetical protein